VVSQRAMKHLEEGAIAVLRFSSGFLVLVGVLLLSGAVASHVVDDPEEGGRNNVETKLTLGFAVFLLAVAAFGIGGTFAHHGGARWVLLPHFMLHLLMFSGAVAVAVACDIFQLAPAANELIARTCAAAPRPKWCGTEADEDDMTSSLADHWSTMVFVSKFAMVFSFVNLVATYVVASHPPAKRRTIVDMQRDHVSDIVKRMVNDSLQQQLIVPQPLHPEGQAFHAYQYPETSNVVGPPGTPYQAWS